MIAGGIVTAIFFSLCLGLLEVALKELLVLALMRVLSSGLI
jgi:hypothetical protein